MFYFFKLYLLFKVAVKTSNYAFYFASKKISMIRIKAYFPMQYSRKMKNVQFKVATTFHFGSQKVTIFLRTFRLNFLSGNRTSKERFCHLVNTRVIISTVNSGNYGPITIIMAHFRLQRLLCFLINLRHSNNHFLLTIK